MEIRDTRNGSWYWVNTAVNACTHISHADKSVYGALASLGGCAEIRPSFEEIATRSNTSIRQAKKSVSNLVAVQIVTVLTGGGRGKSNVYQLNKCAKGCKNCTVSKGCKIVQETVQKSAINGAKNAPQIDKEINKEINKHMSAIADGDRFEKFWSVYPKKEQKKKAREVWKRKKLDSKVDEIVAFVEKAKETDRWCRGYVKLPTTFLNGECWEDNLESYNDAFQGQNSEVIKI